MKHICIGLVAAALILGLVRCSDDSTGSPPVPVLSLSSKLLEFSATAGSDNPPAQRVILTNAGEGLYTYTATTDADWLQVFFTQFPDSLSGTIPDTISVRAITAQAEAGLNVDTILVTSIEAGNSPQRIEVRFTVTENIATEPANLTFSAIAGGADPDPQTLAINSLTGSSTAYDISFDEPWITLSQSSGTTDDSVTVSVSSSSLNGGVYTDSLLITSGQQGADTLYVPVTLTVSSWVESGSGISIVEDLWGIAYGDASTIWLAGAVLNPAERSGVIFKSTDNGLNWTRATTVGGTTFGQINVVDDSTIVAVGTKGTILLSEDTGASWAKVSDPDVDSTMNLWEMTFVGLNGWVVGNIQPFPDSTAMDALILHTNDGGRTWTEQASPVTFSLKSVSFINSGEGWAVGDAASILHTVNGGLNWTKEPAPTGGDYFGVFFIDQVEGWLCGDNGLLLHTTDAGVTWETVDVDVTTTLEDIFFITPTRGWVTGRNGQILFTNDGGETWLNQISGTDVTLHDVNFRNADDGLIVGDDGKVLRTISGGF